jgi:membrane-bound lytic murein transglycosylase B
MLRALALVIAVGVTVTAQAPSQTPSGESSPEASSTTLRPPFPVWLQEVREEALARGISPATVQTALSDVTPVAQILERDRTQAEFKETLRQYVDKRVGVATIRLGRARSAEHRTLLTRLEQTYGVPGRFIVAIWGLESNFGRFSGVRPIIPTLATLAYDPRRTTLFRAELFHALEILDRQHIDLPRLKGSWAGAMGQPQFLPSSYLKYAVDEDGDGLRDIWRSTADVFGSMANYLKAHGWTEGETWGREVRVPTGTSAKAALDEAAPLRSAGCRASRELSEKLPLERWQALGVRTTSGGPLPQVEMDASLLRTDSGTFLVYRNYEALLGYNCAHAYAMAVARLADRIADDDPLPTPGRRRKPAKKKRG